MRRFGLVLIAGLVLCAVSQAATSGRANAREEGVAAFEAIMPVLHHPRCLVCHSTGDYPRQGDDLHRHIMDVRRGPHGEGADPVHCSTCHQTHNLVGLHTPPGAQGWRLPPPESVDMGRAGRSRAVRVIDGSTTKRWTRCKGD